MSRRPRLPLLVLSCVLVRMVLPEAAAAADAASTPLSPGPAPATTKVEEITVTSQKRSENARKVPVSITVLSGAQIKAAHITSFADLTRATPNLSFSSQAGEGLSTLEIRGISSTAGTATVALYLDDVSLTTRNIYTQGTSEPRFLDLSRVEVLRGPQSTLYGASALGGTLRYISNPPKMDVFEGSVFSELSGTYHGSLNWDEQGILNIPLSPGLAVLRIAGETGGDSGYINNVDPATGQTRKSNINSTGFDVARGSLLLTPNDWLTITPSIFWQKSIPRDVDAQYLALPNFQTPKVVAEPGHDSIFVPSLTVNADFGFATLVSITSNYERQYRRTLDSTIFNNIALYTCDFLAPVCGADNPPNPPGLFGALNNLPSSTLYNNTVRQWSQEIRLVSKPYVPGGFPLTWIAGLYYVDEHSTFTDNETVSGINQVFTGQGVSGEDPTVIAGTFPGAFTNNYVFHGLRSYDTAQYAVFGEATYYPQPNIRLTAGGRYSFARDGENDAESNFYSYGNTGLTTSVGHFYSFTPKFAAGWDITPNNTLYANISKGFRLGSENRPIVYDPTFINAFGTPAYDLHNLGLTSAPKKFGPDKLWNFEIGDKARLLGGLLQINADAFYIKWDDIQADITLPTSFLSFETNAGSATSYGVEAELRARPTSTLSVGLSGSALSATYDRGVKAGATTIIGTFAGERIPGVPEFNADINARQDFTITDAITAFASIDVPWIGPSHGDPIDTSPDYKQPPYITTDASFGLDYGRWEFVVFGKNLTNNNKIIQRPSIQGSSVPGYGLNYLGNFVSNLQGFTLRPLTVGANATLKF